ncbi:MAG: protein kinase [Myxococcales bacterium]|nr:protein kinase [Myxococcales bacterium]MCB9749764.1 protein kinase [Myxococcales bacterium]
MHASSHELRIPLGPFDLISCIATGGMGEIWEGVHRVQEVPVAVKVMTGEHVRDPSYHADFRREVEAVAALNHHGIIMVFDVGVIGKAAERMSMGRLVKGCPYLVMDYASRGSLDDLAPPFNWYDFKRITVALLEALGHAHSRGMIHLDIKPGNVLLGSTDDPRPRLKLTDFGIAHALDRQRPSVDEASPHGTVEQARGTPWYMSPEQLCGRWRDYGPWSDLYAFGVLAWELASGERPFDGPNARAIGLKHLEAELPAFAPYIDVPRGLRQWLEVLLAKRPYERFQRASDALAAFRRLGDPHEITTVVRPYPQADDVSEQTHRILDLGFPLVARADGKGDCVALPRDRVPPAAIRKIWPGCPEEEPPPPPALTGAGLGLFNLRTIPFIGRASERGELWSALQDVYLTQSPRAILLRGPSGIGKSRLARWLCERSHEAGASTVLKASHELVAGPSTGLPRMLADHFRCVGLHRWSAKLRLGKQLGRLGIHDVATVEETADFLMLASITRDEPGDEGGANPTPVDGFIHNHGYTARPADRHRLVERLLRHISRTRPLVVWLDDVHFGLDALSFAHRLLAPYAEAGEDDELEPCPILFLLTVTDEALAEREAESAELGALRSLGNVSALQLSPLAPPECNAMVSQMLPLEPELHGRVAERMAGSPLFASQILGDWVQRKALVPGPVGFTLAAGETSELPDDLHASWSARIKRLMKSAGRLGDVQRALEIAAALGSRFTTRELEIACELASVAFSRELLDRLARARLLGLTRSGWRFANAVLRESLRRSAREAGRWQAHNLACAEMLGRVGEREPRAVAERRAVHLHAARRLEDAVDAYLVAARFRHRSGEPGQAMRLLTRRERLLQKLEPSGMDPRWARGWVLAANASLRTGDFQRAIALARRAADVSAQNGDLRTRAEALDNLAFVARREGDLRSALRHSRAALELHDKLDDASGRASALLNLGHTHMDRGAIEDASALFAQACTLYDQEGDEAGVGRCVLAMGHAAARRGQVRAALTHYERARELFESVGNSFLVLACDSGIARIAVQSVQSDAAS